MDWHRVDIVGQENPIELPCLSQEFISGVVWNPALWAVMRSTVGAIRRKPTTMRALKFTSVRNRGF